MEKTSSKRHEPKQTLPIIVSRLWRLSQQGKRLVWLTLLGVLTTLFSVASAQMLGRITQMAVQLDVQRLWPMLAVFACILAASGTVTWVYFRLGIYTKECIAVKLRTMAQACIARASMSWIGRQQTGDLLGRAQRDVEAAIHVLGTYFPHVTQQLLRAAVTFIYITTVHWQLGIVFFVPFPFIYALIMRMSKRMSAPQAEELKRDSDVNTQIQELLTNHTTIKAYRLQSKSMEWLASKMELRFRAQMRKNVIGFLNDLPSTCVTLLPVLLLGGVGGSLMAQGRITLGQLIAVFSLAWPLCQQITELGIIMSSMRTSAVSAVRIFEILDAEQETGGSYGAPVEVETKAAVVFNKVCFAYPAQEASEEPVPVLRELSFAIRPGEMVGVTGPSGSGKSTIIKLITALYTCQSGQIQAWDVPYQQWSLEMLRSRMAVVSQETYLFPGSIAENIRYGVSGEVDEAAIKQACADAGLQEMIQQLPHGLQTDVGERGVAFSGGQRQRIAIARALIRKAPLWLLDEATSALDEATEREVQAVLDRLIDERQLTVLAIAHRLHTLKNADRILVMKAEQIVEEGPHAQLLLRNGLYAELYRQQTGGEAQ